MKRIEHVRKWIALLLCCCLGTALLASCTPAGEPSNPSAAPSDGQTAGQGGQALTFGTMQAGTSTYAVGAALASVWNEHCPYTVTQQPMQVTGPATGCLSWTSWTWLSPPCGPSMAPILERTPSGIPGSWTG